MGKSKAKHILALSGGKDSAALAVYMRENYPDIDLEYVFTDSGCELPETYRYLEKISAKLNIKIESIKSDKDFKWWLNYKNNYLPSPQNRWCTEILKLKPYLKWIEDNCSDCCIHSYVGLRFDERNQRQGLERHPPQFVTHHPFIKDNLGYDDIISILYSSGIGLPDYHSWRSRSGCFFCFYQTKQEWLGLYDHHKDLFYKAARMEKEDPVTGKNYTWIEDCTLLDLVSNRDALEQDMAEVCHNNQKNDKLVVSLNGSCKRGGISNDQLLRRD